MVKVKDKEFTICITAGEICQKVAEIAERINHDYDGKNPLLLGILNGSFIFASDLIRKLSIPCEISFVKFSSYSGTATSGKVKELIGLNEEIRDRHVLVIEDIVDTGLTLEKLLESLEQMGPASLKIACLCFKPGSFRKTFRIDYAGMNIPDDFVVGYGLDYEGFGRNLPEIYKLSR